MSVIQIARTEIAIAKARAFERACWFFADAVACGELIKSDAVDELYDAALANDLIFIFGGDWIDSKINGAFAELAEAA